ncbi:hypothetical protein NDU88_001798 [Pleurodeles waltl]|uniref:Uncharacterized protein n=1 Tax=Pleurodeles waltl TaxID=8319 RepID=A0AAV7MKQ7_PLEWA|nr:hypothetical protein NDU88_001798 [Pleurodeles waltl]
MPSAKACGGDGFPVEFYKTFCEELAPLLTKRRRDPLREIPLPINGADRSRAAAGCGRQRIGVPEGAAAAIFPGAAIRAPIGVPNNKVGARQWEGLILGCREPISGSCSPSAPPSPLLTIDPPRLDEGGSRSRYLATWALWVCPPSTSTSEVRPPGEDPGAARSTRCWGVQGTRAAGPDQAWTWQTACSAALSRERLTPAVYPRALGARSAQPAGGILPPPSHQRIWGLGVVANGGIGKGTWVLPPPLSCPRWLVGPAARGPCPPEPEPISRDQQEGRNLRT